MGSSWRISLVVAVSGTCAVPTTPAGMDDGTSDTTVALDATLTYTVSVHGGWCQEA